MGWCLGRVWVGSRRLLPSPCLWILCLSKDPGSRGLVVATHMVAMDTLALGSYMYALSPTILAGTNPRPHLLFMSLKLFSSLVVFFSAVAVYVKPNYSVIFVFICQLMFSHG